VTGIQRERNLLTPFREGADVVIDTSELSVRGLRNRIASHFADSGNGEGVKTTVISFGYKFGLPLDADIVLDVRFLPNPHWVPGLRELTGLEPSVKSYVIEQTATGEFLKRTHDLFRILLKGYQEEGRHYLTVAIGCTGGRHRSVVLAEEVARLIGEEGYGVKVVHRDVERPPVQR
jgi:UPF0042 nucleotide-binding protein